MPQVGINDEYAGGPSVFDAPKLKPEAKGELARIWIPNPDNIYMAYRHSIGGQRSAVPGAGWGGQWICNGRDEVLKNTNPHSDPEACLLCRMHREGNGLVDKAARKWVTQLFRYGTDPTGNQLMQPFHMRLLVWVFSDKEYRALTSIASSWGALNGHDIIMSCDSKEFQTWTPTVQPQVFVTLDPSFTAYMQESYSQGAIAGEDLERLIGRVASNDNEVLQKIAEVTPAQPGGIQPGQQMGVGPVYTPPPGMMPMPPVGDIMVGQQPLAPMPGAPIQPPAPVYAPPAAAGMVPPPMPQTQQAPAPMMQQPPIPQQLPPDLAQPQMMAPPPAMVAPPQPQMVAPPAVQPQQQMAPPAAPAPVATVPMIPQQQPMAPAAAPPLAPPPQQQMVAPPQVPAVAQAAPGAPQQAAGAPLDVAAMLASPPPPPPAPPA